MIWFNDHIIWFLNDKSILDLLMQHQYNIKIDVNAKYANQKKTEMKRIIAKLKQIYVKKLKTWNKRDFSTREMKFVLNLLQYRKKINDMRSIITLFWLTRLLKFDQVTEITSTKWNHWNLMHLVAKIWFDKSVHMLIFKLN